jgi:hypothetical protein
VDNGLGMKRGRARPEEINNLLTKPFAAAGRRDDDCTADLQSVNLVSDTGERA